METCQRDLFGNVIVETCLHMAVALVIDSSGTMGTYRPRVVEHAVNDFFGKISSSGQACQLIDIAVYESADDVDVVGWYGKATDFRLADVRYGGEWNVPFAVARASEDARGYIRTLETSCGFVCARPIVILVSDNPCVASAMPEGNVAAKGKSAADARPGFRADDALSEVRYVLVRNTGAQGLEGHLKSCAVFSAKPGQLAAALSALADEIVEIVKPRKVSATELRAN